MVAQGQQVRLVHEGVKLAQGGWVQNVHAEMLVGVVDCCEGLGEGNW